MRNIVAVLCIAAVLFGAVACKPTVTAPETDTGTEPGLSDKTLAAVESYLGVFSHAGVLGDIDHVLKGEPVDDGAGVTVQPMKLQSGAIVRPNDEKTEIAVPLTLTGYDYDGPENPENPNPELYTRIATGNVTLTFIGKMSEGSFSATHWKATGLDITLACDTTEYIALELPDVKISAEEIGARFISASGAVISPVTITFTEDGRVAGIADASAPKFELPKSGAVTIDGIATDFAEL